MATLSQSEWKQIRAHQSTADLKYLIALLRRDGVITIEEPESEAKSKEKS
jgi:hypothetical protein